ncbi:MAG: phosphohexomutase domain-containing protein, partial [Candidatus Xenobia bacterium]
SAEGFKISDEMETRIEEMVFSGEDWGPRPTGEDVGRVQQILDAEDAYVEHLKKQLGGSLEGLKVVLDCAHGAACRVGPRLFRELGAEVTSLHDAPNGVNINVNCGSTHPGLLKKAVTMQGADVGLAFDGDADRCLAVDARGRLVDGDQIMLALAINLKGAGKLKGDVVVATVMSNLGLEQALQSRGIKLVRTGVGDRFVLEEMRRIDAVLGGEQSGHIICLDVGPTGDGCFTGARLLQVLKQSGRPLDELVADMKHMPQILVNVKARNKAQLRQDDAIGSAIAELEDVLKDRGRVLVRASGTEPLVRVMAEGPDEQELQQLVGRLAQLIEERLS